MQRGARSITNAINHVNQVRAWLMLLSSLFLSFVEGRAHAHPEWSPVRVNRYCKLVFEPNEVRMVYTLLYGEGPALAMRTTVDADRNGQVDPSERTILGRDAARVVTAGLHLVLDGKALNLTAEQTDVGLAGNAVAPEAYSVDLTYRIPISVGLHELVLDDKVHVPSEGDTEVTVESSADMHVALLRGRAPPSGRGDQVVTFRGPRFSVLEDRSVSVRFEKEQRWRFSVPIVCAIALALTALAGWRWRTKRTKYLR